MMLHRKTEKKKIGSKKLGNSLQCLFRSQWEKSKSGNFFEVHVYVNLDARMLSVYLLPKRPNQ